MLPPCLIFQKANKMINKKEITETINDWHSTCLRENLKPLLLITVDKNGRPAVISYQNKETMMQIYAFLLDELNDATVEYTTNNFD